MYLVCTRAGVNIYIYVQGSTRVERSRVDGGKLNQSRKAEIEDPSQVADVSGYGWPVAVPGPY